MKELLIHPPDEDFYHFLIKISSYVIPDDKPFHHPFLHLNALLLSRDG